MLSVFALGLGSISGIAALRGAGVTNETAPLLFSAACTVWALALYSALDRFRRSRL